MERREWLRERWHPLICLAHKLIWLAHPLICVNGRLRERAHAVIKLDERLIERIGGALSSKNGSSSEKNGSWAQGRIGRKSRIL